MRTGSLGRRLAAWPALVRLFCRAGGVILSAHIEQAFAPGRLLPMRGPAPTGTAKAALSEMVAFPRLPIQRWGADRLPVAPEMLEGR